MGSTSRLRKRIYRVLRDFSALVYFAPDVPPGGPRFRPVLAKRGGHYRVVLHFFRAFQTGPSAFRREYRSAHGAAVGGRQEKFERLQARHRGPRPARFWLAGVEARHRFTGIYPPGRTPHHVFSTKQ